MTVIGEAKSQADRGSSRSLQNKYIFKLYQWRPASRLAKHKQRNKNDFPKQNSLNFIRTQRSEVSLSTFYSSFVGELVTILI